MPPPRIMDAHIHLWPSSAATPAAHAWMRPGTALARAHAVADYRAACAASPAAGGAVRGVVYVETDRRRGEGGGAREWAEGALAEMAFLRRVVVEGGRGAGYGGFVRGVVAWAPLDRGAAAFDEYVREAERVAGPAVWRRVVGFRFLLQGIGERAGFREVALGEGAVGVLRRLGRRRWCFDVGVDQRGGGVWQVETAVEMVERVRDGAEGREVRFILNHLCKPDMEHSPPSTPEEVDAFGRWTVCMERFAKFDTVYMKLSGGSSEIGDQDPENPWPIEDIVERMEPWLSVVFRCFPPNRIMFGSNWPVDNVRGPGDKLSWMNWHAVVEQVLDRYKLSDEDKDRVWYRTAEEAYRLDRLESSDSN